MGASSSSDSSKGTSSYAIVQSDENVKKWFLKKGGPKDAHAYIDEDIFEVHVYTRPLKSEISYHAYVVFKTKWWWWSFERNTCGIQMQKKGSREEVVNYLGGELREEDLSRIKCVISDKGRVTDEKIITVKQLAHWLQDQGEYKLKYDLLGNNCQHFAKKVFDFVAESKHWT